MNSQRHLLIGCAALVFALTANLASATTPGDVNVRTSVVRYSDLDLSQPQDAHRLYVRIEQAARTVCDSPPAADLHRVEAARRCFKQAVSDAVAQVRANQPAQHLYAQFGNR
jgi:UrcA family protein